MLFKYAVLSFITTTAASALEFEQFEGQHHFIDTKVLNTAPDGHELHFIKDAANNIFEWDGTEYSHHDVEVHHNDEGHHLSTVFDFATPPTTLQKDGAGHALVEIYNTRDKTRYQWMYEDGNYHDADMELLKDSPMVQHDIRTGKYTPPKLGYFPYHGNRVTNLLIQAVKNGDFKGIMKLFRTTRVNPNTQDEKGNTALHYAHELALAQIICLLGTHHADFTIRNKAGRTPYEEYEEAIVEQRGEPWMNLVREKVVDDIITAQYRFSPHAEHEHWEPGVKFESENQNDWHPSTGKYYHHEVGQPTGQMEPDKLDL